MDINLWCGKCGYKELIETNISKYHLALHEEGELGGDLVALNNTPCPKCGKKEQMHLSISLPDENPNREMQEKEELKYLETHPF